MLYPQEPPGLRFLVAASAAATLAYTPVLKRLPLGKNVTVAAVVAAALAAGARELWLPLTAAAEVLAPKLRVSPLLSRGVAAALVSWMGAALAAPAFRAYRSRADAGAGGADHLPAAIDGLLVPIGLGALLLLAAA